MSAITPSELAAIHRVTALPGEYLTFRLGEEEYGIDILRVQEIINFQTATRIVGAPPCVIGVLNLRGVIVPIADLRLLLGLDAPCNSSTVTIVLRLGQITVGAVADGVSDVTPFTREQILPAPQFCDSPLGACVLGIGTIKAGDRQRMVILLDIAALMADAIPPSTVADLTRASNAD